MPLSGDQLQHYEDHGFVMVEGLLTTDDLQPAIDEIEAHVGALADALFDAGHIPETYAGRGFFQRLAVMERAYGGAAALFHISGLLGRGIASLWSSPKILAIVEQLIGPDIAGHPVCNVRSKTPQTALMTVPWHQDTAYLLPGVEGTHQPAAWIPFLDVTVETGCLEVKRGAHKAGVFTHRIEREVANPRSWYLYIPEEELADYETVRCEMALGSVLIINQLIPHRSLENLSERVRWSVDLRWQRPDEATGWEGYLDLLEMRRGDDPAFRPDWEGFFAQRARAFEGFRNPGADSFDVNVEGPWIERWRQAMGGPDDRENGS